MKKILKFTTAIVIFLTFISKISGFVREQVLAFQYGANEISDTYLTVLSLPQYISNIIGGVLLSSFVPIYLSLKEREGSHNANNFTAKIFSITLLALVGLNILFFIFTNFIGKIYFGEQVTVEQLFLIKMVLPVQLLMVLSLFLTAKFNANKLFYEPIISTVIMNILFILIIIFFSRSSETLITATIGSAVIQLLYLFYKAKTNKLTLFKIKMENYFTKDVKEFVLMGVPMLIGSIFTQAFNVFDKVLGKGLPEGSIASLSYALKLTQLPTGIIAMGISTVLLSSLSILASKGEISRLNTEVFKSIRITTIILLPIIAIMLFYSYAITKIIFERGAFGPSATQMTSEAVIAYTIGILGTSLTMVLSRVFFATKNTIIPVFSNVVSGILNLVLAILLVKKLDHVGLALANSISVSFNFIFLLFIYLIKNKSRLSVNLKYTTEFIFKLLLTMAVTLGAIYFIRDILNPNTGIINFFINCLLVILIYLLMVVITRLEGINYKKYVFKRRF